MKAAAQDLRPIARLFRALSDASRLRIVALLSHGELCVCHLQEALGQPQPNVSRHLAVLRAAAIVEDRRQGPWAYYRLVPQRDPECERQLRGLVRSFAQDRALRREIRELVERCGPRVDR